MKLDDDGEQMKDPKFSATIERCDGLIIVTPEYNHSFPGLLKHALETSEPRWRGISGTRLKINAWGGLNIRLRWTQD